MQCVRKTDFMFISNPNTGIPRLARVQLARSSTCAKHRVARALVILYPYKFVK